MNRYRFDIELRPVDVRSQLEAVLGSVDGRRGKQVVVGHITDASATSDPLGLRQVLRNLISNAIRYGGDEIEIAATQRGTRVEITVSDNGDGVDPDMVGTLFQPFSPDGLGRQSPHSPGLGLTVSRRLAVAIAGNLTYGRDGGRTRFTVSLNTSRDPGDAEQ